MPASTAPKLIVVPACGLCNRLQAIVCGHLFAADTGRDYYVNWSPESSTCGAEFTDLFQPIYRPLPAWPQTASVYSSIQRYPTLAGRYLHGLGAAPALHFGGLRRDRHENLAIFTCQQFLGYFHDARFVPTLRALLGAVRPEIAQRVESFKRQHFGDPVIGVHIRRQDWRSQRSLDYFLRMMARYQGATFLICSDDASSMELVRQHQPRVIGYPVGIHARGTREAMEDALVEVLLLSQCAALIGTPGSSFSAMAQAAGGMPCNFHYGLSLSTRDWRLGNLERPLQLLWLRLRRDLRALSGGNRPVLTARQPLK